MEMLLETKTTLEGESLHGEGLDGLGGVKVGRQGGWVGEWVDGRVGFTLHNATTTTMPSDSHSVCRNKAVSWLVIET